VGKVQGDSGKYIAGRPGGDRAEKLSIETESSQAKAANL